MKEMLRRIRHAAAHMLLWTEIIRTPSYCSFESSKAGAVLASDPDKVNSYEKIHWNSSHFTFLQREAVQIENSTNYFIREFDVDQNIRFVSIDRTVSNSKKQRSILADNGRDLKLYSRDEAIAALKEWVQLMRSDPEQTEYVRARPSLIDLLRLRGLDKFSPLPSATPI